MYLWMIFVATKVAVCPPNPPWKWHSSADGQKLNIGRRWDYGKIHQVYIINWIMTALEIDDREGVEKKHGGKRTRFGGLTVTFLASVSGRNE